MLISFSPASMYFYMLGCCLIQPRFGSHGACPYRLARLSAQECCRCNRQTCFQKLRDFKDALLQFLGVFWSMAKHVQDEYIRVTSGEQGDSYKEWYLLGKRVGRKCCIAILGLGNSRFQRVSEGRLDRRYSVWGGAPCYKLSLIFHGALRFS